MNRAGLEQPLHDPLVLLGESLMVVTDTMLQSLDEALVADVVEMWLKVFFLDIEETLALVVGAAVRDDIVGRETALATRWDEDDDRSCG